MGQLDIAARRRPRISGICDVERFTSSAAVLDAIMQVAGKSWADDARLAGLVHALDDILHPQANLCSGGGDKRITRTQIKALMRHLE
jgi:hypothetical protein